MSRSMLFSKFLTLTYLSLLIIVNGQDDKCLKKYRGIYLTQDENQVSQLSWYSSDGVIISIDSDQKTGDPTDEGRSDRVGRWKCGDADTADILTQSTQIEETDSSTEPLVARLYETGTTCSDNERNNCSDIIQYRNLTIAIRTDPPEQIYTFGDDVRSGDGHSVFLHYPNQENLNRKEYQCRKAKVGMYAIEYEKESSDGEVKKTYGLLQLKDDGFFTLINSDERENGTHKFGTTLGRWKCSGNSFRAVGNYFTYNPEQRLGEVRLLIDQCSSTKTQACAGQAVSRHYPLQLRQRPFQNGSPETTENIRMIKFLSATETKNKNSFKDFAGTYFILLGEGNDTDGSLGLTNAYRTVQLLSDSRAYGSTVAEILPVPAEPYGNALGYWTCNAVNSSYTHIVITRQLFPYYEIGGNPVLRIIVEDLTCDNETKKCRAHNLIRHYNLRLPYNGQYEDPVTTYFIAGSLYLYAYLPPY